MLTDEQELKQNLIRYKKTARLKALMRDAVELIGNEVIWYLQNRRRAILDDQFAAQITRECLNYTFRFVTLFYLEANSNLPAGLANRATLKATTELDPDGFKIFEAFESAFKILSQTEPYFDAAPLEILSRIKLRNKVLYQAVVILSD